MKSDFIVALTQLAAERHLPREIVLSAIEAALVSAYRKDSVTAGQNLSVKLDPATGEVNVHIIKTVVEQVEDERVEIDLQDARKIKADAQIEESIATETLPHSAGRIAAQTAKQVVMQRLREAERELVFEEFSDKTGEVFAVNIQRIEPQQVVVDLGRAEAILPLSEQAPAERYRAGLKMKVLLQSIERSTRGPELIVSRADKLLLKRLFEMEVPEIFNGAVEIVAIAREPGSRSKVSVRARQDGVDPVGSCVGLRGVRIQNIVNELQGEKIDVVAWSKDANRYIANALSPSQVLHVELDEDAKTAAAVVPDRQLSLAIGREGQNARLAARLTGWSVDIRSTLRQAEVDEKKKAEEAAAEDSDLDLIDDLGLSARTLNTLKNVGVTKAAEVVAMAKPDLMRINGFGEKSYAELHERLVALGLVEAPAETVEPAVEEVEVQEEEAPPVAEAPVIEEAPVQEPVAAEPQEAPAAEPEPAALAPEPVVVEETAEAEEIPEPQVAPVAAEVEPIEAIPVEAEPEPPALAPEPVEVAVEPALAPEAVFASEVVPVGAPREEDGDHSSSIHDLPEDIWSIRRASRPGQPGQIRFAEDIEGLRGGVTSRRERRGEGRGGRRRSRAGRRRVRR